jgi:hypothetical protein
MNQLFDPRAIVRERLSTICGDVENEVALYLAAKVDEEASGAEPYPSASP